MKDKMIKAITVGALLSIWLTVAVLCFVLGVEGGPLLQKVLPVALGMTVLAAVFGYWQGKRLTVTLSRQINAMSAEMPVSGDNLRELQPLQNKINAQEKLRREVFSDISHELKTPLTTISGYAELMEHHMVAEADISAIAGKMSLESRRLLTMIDHVMESGYAGDFAAAFSEMDLKDVVDDVVCRLEVFAREKQIQIVVKGEPCLIVSDRACCERICYNLIENAVKYTDFRGHVWVTVATADDGCELIVADDGVGIDEEYRERVFERFFRADRSHSRETEGNGLGLSIVKNYVTKLGGHITLKSEIGKGTRISVFFPEKTREKSTVTDSILQ